MEGGGEGEGPWAVGTEGEILVAEERKGGKKAVVVSWLVVMMMGAVTGAAVSGAWGQEEVVVMGMGLTGMGVGWLAAVM